MPERDDLIAEDDTDDDAAAAPDAPGEDEELDDDQVTYDLGEWSREARTMLQQLLLGAKVTHAWIGTDLSIGPDDEARVDELVEQVRSTDSPMLDPDAEKVVYEVGTWEPADLFRLTELLAEDGVGYEFDEHGDLVVLASHEEQVDAIIDEIDELDTPPDEPTSDGGASDDGEPAEGDDAWDGDGGLEANDVLSNLYVAADRLQKSANDHSGVLGAVDAANALEGKPPPFGFEPTVWSRIQQRAGTLRDALEGDEAVDAEIQEQAKELRELLSTWI
jgi:hypothetical protein